MSYAHVDNKYGRLTEFRERLSNEVHVQTGEEFPIFQDRNDILLGQVWRERIDQAIQQEVTFLIPILTPSFFKSAACREELQLFLERETELGRSDLVLPVYYIGCRQLDDPAVKAADPLAQAIAGRQWGDWRGLRLEQFDSPLVDGAVAQIAAHVRIALESIESARAASKEATPEERAASKKAQREEHAASSAVTVFMAYSHKDQGLAHHLHRHLAVLEHQGLVDVWHDRRIGAGGEWAGQIDRHLDEAKMILLLISVDFLASEYSYDVEVIRAIDRHNSGDARVIPIILRPCDWGGSYFAKLQSLPADGKPITRWRNRDEALANVARGISKAIKELGDTSGGQGQ